MRPWKARLQVRLCESVLAEMDDPENGNALILYRNALATLRQARREAATAEPSAAAEQERPPRYDSPYLTVEEAAAYCRVAVQTIYNHRREIRRQPGTGKLLFKREDLDHWLDTRPRRR